MEAINHAVEEADMFRKMMDDLHKTAIDARRMGGEQPTPEETLEKLPHENRQMYRERVRQMRKSRKVKA